MDYFDLLRREDIDGLNEFLKTHNLNEELQGQSLLYWAVHSNNLVFTKHLVHQGAIVNKTDRLGKTPLLIACYFGFVDIASFLLNTGAVIDGCLERAMRGWDGHTQTEIIELLKKFEKKY